MPSLGVQVNETSNGADPVVGHAVPETDTPPSTRSSSESENMFSSVPMWGTEPVHESLCASAFTV